MNSCCFSQCRAGMKDHSPSAFCVNAEECIKKLGLEPVHIAFIWRLRSIPFIAAAL